MAKFESVPEYVLATPAEIVAAHKQLTELKKNPAFALMQGARRAAVQAKFGSGMHLTALEYVEFADVVPPGFSTRMNAGLGEQNARAEAERRKTLAEFQEQERKRRETPRPMTRAEAQAYLSTAAYNEWCRTNQDVIARENL
jgi:hypothetical protein